MSESQLLLRGPGGEPIDLMRTFNSHGVTDLPPMKSELSRPLLTVTLPAGSGARTVTVKPGRRGRAVVVFEGREPGARQREQVLAAIRHILRFDEDLSGFYGQIADDPDLAWAAEGAGRMIRSATVFEEVVKTVCTTNCTWSATERMVGAIVGTLGTPAPGTRQGDPAGHTFPTAEAMASVGEAFYRDVARAGYRGGYLLSLARQVAGGEIDLESLGSATVTDVSDEQMEERLLALPGVGPYAAAHVMTMLGRYSRLILDSWTRPTYARLVGREKVPDATIHRRFKRYGSYAGLAFWLFLTRDWVPEA